MKCFNCRVTFNYRGIKLNNGKYVCCRECRNIYQGDGDIDFTEDVTPDNSLNTEYLHDGDDSIVDCGCDDGE